MNRSFGSEDPVFKDKAPEDFKVLAIETSCDETSSAVVRGGRVILSNVVSSQIDVHRKFGGVVPEIASRKHVEMLIPVVDEAIKNAGMKSKTWTPLRQLTVQAWLEPFWLDFPEPRRWPLLLAFRS